MTAGATPELSVIIPTRNEAGTLPNLLADLAAQRGVGFEVLISDGNSADGTREMAATALSRLALGGGVLNGLAGRGRQLNRGAAQAKGTWLLFLHADSRFRDPAALSVGLAALRRDDNPCLAGHFTLCFDLPRDELPLGYYYCEIKARTGLPGTIHGDQGFLLPAAFFHALGGFREDLPVLEDTLLAETIRARGDWRLLPAVIFTSPRRFQAEGYRQRQTLNALLMNFAFIGWDTPLHRAPDLYRSQDRACPLNVAAFFRLVDELLDQESLRERWQIWYRTGEHVRGNAWQLLLGRTARSMHVAGLPPDAVPLEPVLRFRRRFDLLTGHPPGRLAAALLTWLWFRTRRRPSRQGA
jgi:rSAM/selenodomain-associated transferase 2